MGLKDLREKFHAYDAKLSSMFHKDKDGLKKPSWGKIIPTWLGLIILLVIVSSIASALFIADVNQEITPTSATYTLDYSSYKSSIYYIYFKSGSGPNTDAYHISYDGKLKLVIDTSDIPHDDYLRKILESYQNGENEFNASISYNLTAYDSSDNEIDTSYFMMIDNDKNSDMNYNFIDLLRFDDPKLELKDGFLTITFNGKDKRLSDSPFNDSLKNIDHIDVAIHIFNKNAEESSDPGFYNYILYFTIPKSSINVKMS